MEHLAGQIFCGVGTSSLCVYDELRIRGNAVLLLQRIKIPELLASRVRRVRREEEEVQTV